MENQQEAKQKPSISRTEYNEFIKWKESHNVGNDKGHTAKPNQGSPNGSQGGKQVAGEQGNPDKNQGAQAGTQQLELEPSVKPVPDKTAEGDSSDEYECSECGAPVWFGEDRCHSCGAVLNWQDISE